MLKEFESGGHEMALNYSVWILGIAFDSCFTKQSGGCNDVVSQILVTIGSPITIKNKFNISRLLGFQKSELDLSLQVLHRTFA